jgi:hypothetical protein
MGIIDLLVIHPSPHLGAPTRPSTFKMVRTKECTPTHSSSNVFTFKFAFECFKECGGCIKTLLAVAGSIVVVMVKEFRCKVAMLPKLKPHASKLFFLPCSSHPL